MDGDHVQATRSEDGEYAFVYLPSGKPVTVDLRLLSGSMVAAHWYDPRTGKRQRSESSRRGKRWSSHRPHRETIGC